MIATPCEPQRDLAPDLATDGLRAALRCANGRLAEPGCTLPSALSEDVVIALGLRTDTAWHACACGIVFDELRHRIKLDAEAACAIRTALHEAVCNAVVHGNLNVSSAGRDSLDGLRRFHAEISARLARPEMARLRVLIVVRREKPGSVRIEVSDEGQGFLPNYPWGTAPPVDQPHGRGLLLIDALTTAREWRQAQRTLSMEFALRGDESRP